MKNKTDFFIGLTLLAFCCVMGYEIHLIPEPAALDFFSAGSFPTGVTIALALLSLILVGRTITGKDKDTACWPERKLAVKVGLMAAWILAYVVGFIFLGEYAYDAEWPEGTGFLISTLIFLSGAQVLTDTAILLHFSHFRGDISLPVRRVRHLLQSSSSLKAVSHVRYVHISLQLGL
ncbi:MAG: tripartite tricarboxylate transporter TctB family protein [Bilophila wadsworthia]